MHSIGLVSPLGVVCAEGPNSPQLTKLCALLDSLLTTWFCEERGGHMHSIGLVSPLGVVCGEGPNSPQLTKLCALLDFLLTTWVCEERGGKTCTPKA